MGDSLYKAIYLALEEIVGRTQFRQASGDGEMLNFYNSDIALDLLWVSLRTPSTSFRAVSILDLIIG